MNNAAAAYDKNVMTNLQPQADANYKWYNDAVTAAGFPENQMLPPQFVATGGGNLVANAWNWIVPPKDPNTLNGLDYALGKEGGDPTRPTVYYIRWGEVIVEPPKILPPAGPSTIGPIPLPPPRPPGFKWMDLYDHIWSLGGGFWWRGARFDDSRPPWQPAISVATTAGG